MTIPRSFTEWFARLSGSAGERLARVSLGTVGHPRRDWNYLLAATAILMIVSIGASSSLLLTKNEEGPVAATPIKVGSFDRGLLTKTVEALVAREDAFEALKRRPPPLVDPSR